MIRFKMHNKGDFIVNQTDLKTRTIMAEIEMHGMVAQNKLKELMGEHPAYVMDDFERLIEKYKLNKEN